MKRLMILAATAVICMAAGPATRPAVVKVVFLLDSSGSMMAHFGDVRQDAARRVADLADGALFNVLLLAEDEVRASTAKMVAAGPATKRAALELLNHSAPHGSGEIIPSLRSAFEQQADEIWFYSDGDAPDWGRVLVEVDRLLKGHRVRINTGLQWGVDAEHEGIMIEIARKSGGVCLDREGKPMDLQKVARYVPGADAKPEPPPGNRGVRIK